MDNDNIEEHNPRDLELSLRQTKIVGIYRHVIRLEFPCGSFGHAKGPHGEAPTLAEFIRVLKDHKDSCEECD